MAATAPWASPLFALLARQLAAGRCVRLAVTTGSMAPYLQPGDHVLLAPARSLRVGDIVAVGAPPRLLVHRVVAVRGRGEQKRLVTKGDAGATYDPPLGTQAPLGRVVAVQRRGATLATTTPPARLSAHLLAALSCLHAGIACLHPCCLRRPLRRLLRRVVQAVAALAWATAQPAAARSYASGPQP